MNTSDKQFWQAPQTDHILVEVTPPVLVEHIHAPPEDPGVEVPEEPNLMPAEPDLPAQEQDRPGEGFAARYPTRIRHQTQRR